jgi:MYXO-CTERM domain-containing protein
MWKYVGIAATMIAAMCGTPNGHVFGQQLLSSFENSLATTAGGAWEGQWTVNPDFTPIGATEGSMALAVHHSPTWVTDGTVLKVGLPLAQQVAQHDFMLVDMTTTDLGIAGDGLSPAWRQVFAIFNSNQGGWQQNQIDFPVAADDGTSLTSTAILDLVTTGIKANAQAFVDAGGGPNSYWELFLIFQGGDQGTPIKAGDYNSDNFVNAADYIIWRDTVGGTTLANETVSPGVVDAADYDEWRKFFGSDYSKITTIIDNIRFANAGSGAGGLSSSSAPEPSSAVLALVAAIALFGRRRMRE